MSFKQLNLDQDVLKAINDMGFEKPTKIQTSCIPIIKQGKDVVGRSLTGSGKTAAFGLPLIEKVEMGNNLQAIVIAPVRELAHQVADELKKFSKYKKLKITTVYGGVSINPQITALKTTNIVVATPGRLLDHMNRGTINTNNVKYLVLDEADKMFEMGFIEDIKRIMGKLPRGKQSLLFSATMPQEVRGLIERFLNKPVYIQEDAHVDRSKLKQIYYDIRSHDKFSLLVHLLKHKTDGLALVFCSRRSEVDIVAKNLKKQGIHAMAIHGGLTQNRRSNALDALKDDKIDVLVATEVAGRGIDIENITQVYSYDCAQTSQEYTHRIGRTARAGKSGEAVTLLTPRDHDNFGRVISDSQITIEKAEVPEFKRVPFDRSRSYGKRRHGGKGRSRRPRRR